MRVGGMRVGGMGVMRVMRVMPMEEQSPMLSWDVLVSSPLNGCWGCILADAWVAEDSALGRGEQRCKVEERGELGGRSYPGGRQLNLDFVGAASGQHDPAMVCTATREPRSNR